MFISIGLMLVLQGIAASSAAEEAVHAICNTVTDDNDTQNELLRRLDSLGEQGKQALLRVGSLGGGGQSWERSCAWQHLTRLNDVRVIPLLRAAVNSPAETGDNRRLAVDALGRCGDKDSVSRIAPLLESADALDRAAAATALGLITSEEALAALQRAFRSGRDLDYPWPIIEALGRHRDSSIVPRLREISAKMEPDRAFQETVALALARIGTRESIDALEVVVQRMSPGVTRRYAVTDAVAELQRILKETDDLALRQRVEQAVTKLTQADR